MIGEVLSSVDGLWLLPDPQLVTAEMFSFLPALADRLTRQVDTPEAARAAIAELDRARVDLVKLVLEPGVESQLPRMKEEVFRAAVDEAKKRRLRTTVHVGTDADVVLAVEAGADGIMTSFGIVKKYRNRMAGRISITMRLDGGPSLFREDWLANTEWSLLHTVEEVSGDAAWRLAAAARTPGSTATPPRPRRRSGRSRSTRR